MMQRRNNRTTIRCILFVLALAAPGMVGCASNTQGTTDKRMFVSNEDFNNGRDDGRRDAKASWSDTSSAWLWNWMMSSQYKTGYEQGWREGRAEAKFESQKSDAESMQN
ncbi:MAG: hypothetical protein H6818_07760 [Phycisphaerales bacterium]|nr:hypothetical protein [Phycisphaerales bacterium]